MKRSVLNATYIFLAAFLLTSNSYSIGKRISSNPRTVQQRKVAPVSNNNYRWDFGRSSGPTTRFHNRLIAPKDFDGLTVKPTIADYKQPGITRQHDWSIFSKPDTVFSATILELNSLSSSQELIYKDISSFSAVINGKPDFTGPGDVIINGLVARDNIYYGGTWPDFNVANALPVLKSIDAYLQSNWPVSASKMLSAPLESLDIIITIDTTVKQNNPTILSIQVMQDKYPLPLFDLSFRLLADPGTISRKEDGTLLFSSTHTGKAIITIDVLKTTGTVAYGQATATIEVIKKD